VGVESFVSAVVTGIVIGGLGRLLSPSSGRMGCLLTLLIGITASLVGSILAIALGAGWVLTLVLQIAVAAVLVALVRV
jgi:uncharacterized membrane protein YeaQ/YmgE (transglycosylase-associated protein family)